MRLWQKETAHTKAVRQIQDNPIYAGMMETLDDAVGLLMQRMEKLGLDKNTVIIFTADNGGVSSGDAYATSCLPLRGGKGRQWEGGIRVPCYIYVPGQKPQVISTPVTGADFYPTILKLAGLNEKPEQHKDGLNLTPLMQNGKIAERKLFWYYPHYGNQGGEPSAIIRSGQWKLIHYYEDGRHELYNLDNDISEHYDISKTKPEISSTMLKDLKEWLEISKADKVQKDQRFDAEKKQQQLKSARTKKMRGLEKTHQNYFNPDYQPPARNGYLSESDYDLQLK